MIDIEKERKLKVTYEIIDILENNIYFLKNHEDKFLSKDLEKIKEIKKKILEFAFYNF